MFKGLIDVCLFFPCGTEVKTITQDNTVGKNVQKQEKMQIQSLCIAYLEKRKEKMWEGDPTETLKVKVCFYSFFNLLYRFNITVDVMHQDKWHSSVLQCLHELLHDSCKPQKTPVTVWCCSACKCWKDLREKHLNSSVLLILTRGVNYCPPFFCVYVCYLPLLIQNPCSSLFTEYMN